MKKAAAILMLIVGMLFTASSVIASPSWDYRKPLKKFKFSSHSANNNSDTWNNFPDWNDDNNNNDNAGQDNPGTLGNAEITGGTTQGDNYSYVNYSVLPEPVSAALFVLGGVSLSLLRRKRNK